MAEVHTAPLPPDAREILAENLSRIREEFASAAARAGRAPESVQLLPVTKYVTGDVVRLLHSLGLQSFAENRVQRGVALCEEVEDLEPVTWHFIGHLQRNKVRRALGWFDVLHSIDSARLAREVAARLRERNERRANPLRLYVEVNTSGEEAKTGLSASEAPAVLEVLANEQAADESPLFVVEGLMTMARFTDDPENARRDFACLRELRDKLCERGALPAGAGLSMGMSRDFSSAIAEGATVVRIGRRLFDGILPER